MNDNKEKKGEILWKCCYCGNWNNEDERYCFRCGTQDIDHNSRFDKQYNFIWGDSTNILDPEHIEQLDFKFDIIICDPLFKPRKKPYKQIREKNQNQLKSIKTPKGEKWFKFFEGMMKIDCVKIIKLDDYSARQLYKKYEDLWQYSVIWDKMNIGTGYKFRKKHELLEILCNKELNIIDLDKIKEILEYFEKEIIEIYNKDSKFYWKQMKAQLTHKFHGSSQNIAFPSVVSIPSIKGGLFGKDKKNQEHINQTPFELWIPFLDRMCKKGDTILDPFMGTGSIAKAIHYINETENKNLKYIGIDIDKEFVDYAEEHYKEHRPGKELRKYYKPKNEMKIDQYF